MLNLLPQEEKKHLRREYMERLGVIILGGVFITLFIGIALLLPSFFLSKAREEVLMEQAAITRDSVTLQEKETLEETLRAASQKLTILAREEGEVPLRLVFETILNHKTEGIALTELFYAESEDVVTLSASGVAERRSDLLKFSGALREDPLFTNIQLPVSNLAEDRDISFTITIRGDF